MTTRHDWIRALEALTPTVAAMGLTKSLADEPYWDASAKRPLNKHGYNFSGSTEHNVFLARTFDGLVTRQATHGQLRKLVTDLTSRSTYGTFTELAAYGVLVRHDVPFRIQIPATAADVLNPNGSELDGEIGGDVLFDVKAFGLQEQLVELVVERLKQDFAPDFVSAEGKWNVPVSFVEGLLKSPEYNDLKGELRVNRCARRGIIEFVLCPPAKVQVSARTMEPLELAAQNANYAFNYAKQFARQRPFILIFVFHPWLSALPLSTNFADYANVFMQEFARRTFNQFVTDKTNTHFGATRAQASKMLSGLLFMDAWQGTDPPTRDTMRLYLNSHADRPVPENVLLMLQQLAPQLHLERINP